MFEGTFTQAPLTASQYIEEPSFKEKTLALPGAQPLETLQTAKRLIVEEKPDDFNGCVAWARLLWQELFHNQIAQLLHNFPPDQVRKIFVVQMKIISSITILVDIFWNTVLVWTKEVSQSP